MEDELLTAVTQKSQVATVAPLPSISSRLPQLSSSDFQKLQTDSEGKNGRMEWKMKAVISVWCDSNPDKWLRLTHFSRPLLDLQLPAPGGGHRSQDTHWLSARPRYQPRIRGWLHQHLTPDEGPEAWSSHSSVPGKGRGRLADCHHTWVWPEYWQMVLEKSDGFKKFWPTVGDWHRWGCQQQQPRLSEESHHMEIWGNSNIQISPFLERTSPKCPIATKIGFLRL